MKIRRHKKVHKYINFYINKFGFREPFQVLIDGTFCSAALKNKVSIKEQLPKYLQAELKLLTTQCIVLETEELGREAVGAMKIVKQFAIHKCGHEKKPVTGSLCLKSMVKNRNENRYIIATQDRELQEKLREIPGVPLLYLHQITPVFDPPSEASLKFGQLLTGMRFTVSKTEDTKLSKMKEEMGIVENVDKPKRRRKKKKGVNPLSCLKKKQSAENFVSKNDGECSAEKTRRKRVRISKHVREELLKNS